MRFYQLLNALHSITESLYHCKHLYNYPRGASSGVITVTVVVTECYPLGDGVTRLKVVLITGKDEEMD